MDDTLLNSTFAALADPTRRAMLARLAQGDATVSELAAPFDITLQAISKHLKVLERAGLVSRGRDGQKRPCRLEASSLREADVWLERFRASWEERFDALEAVVEDLKRTERRPRRRKEKKT